MKKNRSRNTRGIYVLVALGIVATFGPSINYVNMLFDSAARWIILAMLFALLLCKRRFFMGLHGVPAYFTYAFLTICTLSTLWSDLPRLTGPKAGMYVAVSLCYMSAGAYWLSMAGRRRALDLLWPIPALAILTGLGGAISGQATIKMNENVDLFRGLADNSNFLGILILCALPLLLWVTLRSQTTRIARVLGGLLIAAMVVMLLQTFSRAAFLAVAVLACFALIGMGARKTAGTLICALAAASIVTFSFPQLAEHLHKTYVLKGDPYGAILASREDAWQASADGASAGGLFGIGLGVSHGFLEFDFALGASSYGREKGNVSLAMIEEIGVAGFLAFLLAMITLYSRLINTAAKSSNSDDRLLLHILLGSIVALLVNSQFEAWLLSPGGVATPVFWILVGVSAQASRSILREISQHHRIPPVTVRAAT